MFAYFAEFSYLEYWFNSWVQTLVSIVLSAFCFQSNCSLNCLEKYLKSVQRISERFREIQTLSVDEQTMMKAMGKWRGNTRNNLTDIQHELILDVRRDYYMLKQWFNQLHSHLKSDCLAHESVLTCTRCDAIQSL